MRRKIFRLSEDRFDNARPDIKIEGDLLSLSAYEGEHFSASFTISSENFDTLRGMVFSSNPYVVLDSPSFEGNDITVGFSVRDGIGHTGDRIEGDFFVISDGFSKDIPFSIDYLSPVTKIKDKTITTLSDFRDFYKANPVDALSFFSTDAFYAFMKRQGKKDYLLYKGYSSFPKTFANLEEFLIAAGLKKRTGFLLSDSSLTFTVEDTDLRESVELTKTDWGYTEISVTSDSDFITVGHEKITDDYFIAGIMHFDFYIHPARMHAGKNYARLTFSSTDEEKTLTVLCVKDEPVSRDDSHRLITRSKVRLTKEYITYRFGGMKTKEWCDSVTGLLDTLIEMDPQNALDYVLMKTHAYILNENKMLALSSVEELKVSILDKKSTQWAYLLYLCTMIEKEKSYIDRLTAEVETIFRETDDDPKVFWLLLFLREKYLGNPLSELSDIRSFVEAGHYSPFFYVEALTLMEKDPLIVKSFDEFTLRVLRWAADKNRITGNIALRMSYILSSEKKYDSRVFAVVSKAYSKNPTQELLSSILKYLLRNSVYGADVLPWYFLAMKADFSLAGLYEAFVMSLPNDYMKPLPEDVIRYFGYKNTIGYQKKAFVFANLIENKGIYPAIYEDLKKTVELFALENMRRTRISEDLCIIYQDVLNRGIIDADVSAMVGKMLLPCRVKCIPRDVIRVHLFEAGKKEPYSVPVNDSSAYLPIASKDYRIILERPQNVFVADEGSFLVEELLDTKKIMKRLYSESADRLPYFIYAIGKGEDEDKDSEKPFMDRFGDDAVSLIEGFLSDSRIPVAYKNEKYGLFIPYLREHLREDIFREYLLKEDDLSEMDTKTLAYTADLFVKNEEYEKAYELLSKFYGLKMTARLLLSLVTERIKKNPDESDDFLVSAACYLMGVYLINDVTAAYLSKFYVGPCDVMCDIWKHLTALTLPTDSIGERIITESLYTEDFPKQRALVFEAYLQNKPNRMIVEAWFTFFARAYMKNKSDIEESIFPHLSELYKRGEHLNESCLCALLKYLCLKDDLSDDEKKNLSGILSEAIRRNLYFGFYRNAPDDLLIKYHLYDKYFVTYEGEEGKRIMIRLLGASGGVNVSDMVEMYPGIYISQFILFFGDRSGYEIIEKDSDDIILKKGEISCTDENSMGRDSRYGLLNRMRSSLIYYEEREIINSMKKYYSYYTATEELFSLRR